MVGAVRHSREHNLELLCPKDFHGYSGVDVCLLFCRKKRCPDYRVMRKDGLND